LALSGFPAAAQISAPSTPAEPAAQPQADLAKRMERPALDTDEGGLWGMMDREETRLRRSPLTLRDPVLSKYL
jgi:beta-barrel assembly-enhancing protease